MREGVTQMQAVAVVTTPSLTVGLLPRRASRTNQMSKLPRNWKIKELSEVATIQTGLAKGKNNLKNPVSLPYLRVANVQDGYFDLSEIKTIEVSSAEIERYRLKPNDVLLTEGGDFDKLGRGHIWRGQIDPCLHQNHIFVVRPNPQILKPEFLTALTASHYGRTYFLSCSKQTTNLASVNSTQLKQFPVLLPPIREQEEIARIVGCWDRAIEQAEKLVVTKTSIKRGLVQQLLSGGKRFAEFGNKAWQEAHFGDFLTESRIPGSNGVDAKKITVKLYGKGVVEKAEKLLGSANTKYHIRRTGQFIYSKLDFLNGAFGIITEQLDGYESTLDLPAFDIDERLDPLWLFYFVSRSHFYKSYANAAKGGRKARRVQPDEFLKTKARFPSIEEQRRIAAVLNACDKEITLLKQQLDALKRQKQGLMQKLLTGQIRVKV